MSLQLIKQLAVNLALFNLCPKDGQKKAKTLMKNTTTTASRQAAVAAVAAAETARKISLARENDMDSI
jgi:hypothetical protein